MLHSNLFRIDLLLVHQLSNLVSFCLICNFFVPFSQTIPPLVQLFPTNEVEPWCKFQRLVLPHALQFLLGNVSGGLDLIRVGSVLNIGLDEQNVIDLTSESANGSF